MRRDSRFDVVGAIDRAPGRAEALAQKLGLRRHAQAGALREVPWLDEVDAITVATAPMGHYALIREALQQGKHVLTEKPFTMTVAEGEDLLRVAESADRRLAVVHNFQFARSTRALLADLERGEIGEITGIDAVQFGNPRRRLPAWYEELPLGLFYDESPHLLYLLRRLAGPLHLHRSLVTPSSRGLVTPARVNAHFKAPELGRPVSLSCNFESPVSEWFVMVFGTKRLAIVDVFRDIYVSLPNDEAHDTPRVLRTSLVATAQHWLQHVTSGVPHLRGTLLYGNDEVFARFARSIGGEPEALEPISADRALEVLKLQHAIVDTQEPLAQ